IPRIRSERPAFEAHYPHLLERLEREAHAGGRKRNPHAPSLASAMSSHGRRQGESDPDPES
ncbi:MAG TPA: hypothetical protein VHS54_12085, partial [Jatrophihabitans sp.]|nr:hypothetical protein [Jatrophihabitans sp.]